MAQPGCVLLRAWPDAATTPGSLMFWVHELVCCLILHCWGQGFCFGRVLDRERATRHGLELKLFCSVYVCPVGPYTSLGRREPASAQLSSRFSALSAPCEQSGCVECESRSQFLQRRDCQGRLVVLVLHATQQDAAHFLEAGRCIAAPGEAGLEQAHTQGLTIAPS